MLSRLAESFYWIGRYIERAEAQHVCSQSITNSGRRHPRAANRWVPRACSTR